MLHLGNFMFAQEIPEKHSKIKGLEMRKNYQYTQDLDISNHYWHKQVM